MAELELIDKRRWYDRLAQEPERAFVALLFLLASVGWWLNPEHPSDFGNPQGFAYLTATVRTLYIIGAGVVLAGLVAGRRNLEAAGHAVLLAGTTTAVLASLAFPPDRPFGPRAAAQALTLLAALVFASRLWSLNRPLKAELRPTTSGTIVLRDDTGDSGDG